MNYLEDLIRFVGIFLLMLGVEHIVSSFQPDEPEEPPRRYGGVKPTTRDIKPITPATPPPPPSPRAPADEVYPPWIPPKETR